MDPSTGWIPLKAPAYIRVLDSNNGDGSLDEGELGCGVPLCISDFKCTMISETQP